MTFFSGACPLCTNVLFCANVGLSKVCVRVRVCACVRACVRACMHACVLGCTIGCKRCGGKWVNRFLATTGVKWV